MKMKHAPIYLIPYAEGMTGCRRGPHAILSYRNGIGVWSGNIAELPAYHDAESTAVESARLFAGKDNYIVLGGDHSASAGVVRALSNTFGKIHLVVFDAHTDEYEQGHTELNCGNWIRKEKDCFSGITRFGCRDSQAYSEKVSVTNRIHISVDLDVLDAKEYGFSANFPESNGMTLEKLCRKIEDVASKARHPITADISEYNPTLDVTGAGAYCANKILDVLHDIVSKQIVIDA